MTRPSLRDDVPNVPRTARFFAGVPDAAGTLRPSAAEQQAEPEFVCFTALLREVLVAARVQGDAFLLSEPGRVLGRQAV